jgi:hypothetical protein
MKTLIALFVLIAGVAGAGTYPVVDTGQTTAYGSSKGQDAHYVANAPSYKDNADGTVTDTVTGLMWTQDPGEKMTWDASVKNASECRVGGYKDWRLPSIKELYSLILFTGTDPDPTSTDTSNLKPFIDEVFDFKYGDTSKGDRIIDSQFATTAIYTATTMGGNKTMFGVNFADGRIKGYPVASRRGSTTFHVLYVRGNSDYGENKFEDNGDGTITDEATGLTWMQADSGKGMDWPTALEYAENMTFAGHSDWRLPTAKELQSIVDYSRAPESTGSAAIDPLFECTPGINEAGQDEYFQYWTSTTHLSTRSSDSAAYVCFGRALGWMQSPGSTTKTLMDVHGAGAQRSDPKTGDASQFPYGRGPQGDVIRIDNMVRLVRGGDVETVDAPVATTSIQRASGRQRSTQTSGQTQSSIQTQNSAFMTREDSNGDGKVSKTEFQGPAAHFDRLDKNGDGSITADEAPGR